MKRSAKAFLTKLRKLGVKLDDNGDLDLSEVKHDNEKKYIMKN